MKENNIPEKLSADVLSALNSAPIGEKVETEQQAEQRKFEEWLKSRTGLITSSNFGKLDVLPKDKEAKERGELGQTAKSYINTVVAEVYGAPRKELDIYQFRHGNKYEPVAIKELEEKLGVEIQFKGENQKCFKIGKYFGATPDGLFGHNFGVEAKCPVDPNKHIEHIKIKTQAEFKKKRKDWYWQCMGGMLTTGRKYWLFVSFYPYFEGDLRMSILVIKRDEKEIEHLESIIGKGKKYMNQTIKDLENNDTTEIIKTVKKLCV